MTTTDISNLVKKLKSKDGAEVFLKSNKANPPKSLSYHDSRRSYTPDIVVVFPNKQDYYAVEKKITASSLPDLISKWILFALEARLKSGKFFVVVPAQEGKRCQDIIDRKLLSAEVITIK
jgi:hypothetical protein